MASIDAGPHNVDLRLGTQWEQEGGRHLSSARNTGCAKTCPQRASRISLYLPPSAESRAQIVTRASPHNKGSPPVRQ